MDTDFTVRRGVNPARANPTPRLGLAAMSDPGASNGHSSPFLEIDRADWAALAPTMAAPLSQSEIIELRGLGDSLDLREVTEVYLPLSRLLNLYVGGARQLHKSTTDFLGSTSQETPFVIGVA